MKKLLFIFTLLFAFSISASAQAKKTATVSATTAVSVKQTPEVAARKDADDLKSLLALNETRTTDFYNLFKMKYETLTVPDLSAERKSVLKTIMEQKISASVSGEEMTKLQANAALYKRLVE